MRPFDSAAFDPFFGPPFVDVDEWREPPTPHRYVHGGFEGTDTRFSIYFPPVDQYGGRFFHHIEGGNGGHETTATGPLASVGGIDFAASCGAYLVESNQGHFADDLSILRTQPTVHAFRASVHSARYARHLAAALYGDEPAHGYVFGGSGGSPRALLCLERAPDLFDGAVPYIMGHGTSWSLGFSLQANAARLLGAQLHSVVDAMAPGGSGDPFDGLGGPQREALAALYRAGLPRGAEASLLTSGYLGTFASHIDALASFDSGYFEDFWHVPGYAGADGLLDDCLVDGRAVVVRVVTAGDLRTRLEAEVGQGSMSLVWQTRGDPRTPVGLELEPAAAGALVGAAVTVRSGRAAGHRLYCVGVHDGVVVGGGDAPYRFEGVEPGDEVGLDNRRYLAYCYLHRHQVDPSAPEYRQFEVDGRPIHPQRPARFADSGMLSGDTPSGVLAGKVIVVQSAHDAACWPNAALSFQRQVASRLGDRLDDHFRLWFTENAAHVPASVQPPGPIPTATNRLVDYQGCLEQALRCLVEWVEGGSPPPGSSGYEVDGDQCFRLLPDAARRRGVQPVVALHAGAAASPPPPVAGLVRASVGEAVTFTATAEAAPGVGRVVAVEWDFEGRGTWAERDEQFTPAVSVVRRTEHRYRFPGTYFGAVRVTSSTDPDRAAPFGRMANLARVRVVVGSKDRNH